MQPFLFVGATASRPIAKAIDQAARTGPFLARVTAEPDRAVRLAASGLAALVVVDRRVSGAELVERIRRADYAGRLVSLGRGARGADEQITLPAPDLAERLALPVRSSALSFGPLAVAPALRGVIVNSEPVRLTAAEYGILLLLLTRRGGTATQEEILIAALGGSGNPQNAYFHVHNLKAKLGAAAELVENVWGEGYRLRAPSKTPASRSAA